MRDKRTSALDEQVNRFVLDNIHLGISVLLYKVQVYARTRDKYYTFFTPECAKAIQEYLDYRKRCEEIRDESPLFRRAV